MAQAGVTYLFGSNNAGKIAEVRAYCERLGASILALSEVRVATPLPYVAEVNATYEGNAKLKARAFAEWSNMRTISDDTGLEFELLAGLPGIFTAYYGLERVRRELFPMGEVSARFVCCMSYAEPGGGSISLTRTLPGTFWPRLAVEGSRPSLPYAAYFIPRGQTQTLDQLIPQGFESHRGAALRTLLSVL